MVRIINNNLWSPIPWGWGCGGGCNGGNNWMNNILKYQFMFGMMNNMQNMFRCYMTPPQQQPYNPYGMMGLQLGAGGGAMPQNYEEYMLQQQDAQSFNELKSAWTEFKFTQIGDRYYANLKSDKSVHLEGDSVEELMDSINEYVDANPDKFKTKPASTTTTTTGDDEPTTTTTGTDGAGGAPDRTGGNTGTGTGNNGNGTGTGNNNGTPMTDTAKGMWAQIYQNSNITVFKQKGTDTEIAHLERVNVNGVTIECLNVKNGPLAGDWVFGCRGVGQSSGVNGRIAPQDFMINTDNGRLTMPNKNPEMFTLIQRRGGNKEYELKINNDRTISVRINGEWKPLTDVIQMDT